MESYSNLPHSYEGEGASPAALMGDYNFSVTDYEVFTPVVMTKSLKSERYQWFQSYTCQRFRKNILHSFKMFQTLGIFFF